MSVIREVSENEKLNLYQTIILALENSEYSQWFYPGTGGKVAGVEYMDLLCGSSFSTQTAFTLDEFKGVSVWLSSAQHSDSERIERIHRYIDTCMDKEKQRQSYDLFNEVSLYSPKGEYLHLQFIATLPEYQNKGYGALLLEDMLLKSDREGLPVYLVSSDARNLNFYLRHGFEALGSAHIPGFLSLYPMIRYPQKSS